MGVVVAIGPVLANSRAQGYGQNYASKHKGPITTHPPASINANRRADGGGILYLLMPDGRFVSDGCIALVLDVPGCTEGPSAKNHGARRL
jgi:hypothetical protein